MIHGQYIAYSFSYFVLSYIFCFRIVIVMDIVLDYGDYYFFSPYVYPSSWQPDDPYRQILSLLVIANLGGYVLYLMAASLSYFFIFDQRLMKHPLILKVSQT